MAIILKKSFKIQTKKAKKIGLRVFINLILYRSLSKGQTNHTETNIQCPISIEY